MGVAGLAALLRREGCVEELAGAAARAALRDLRVAVDLSPWIFHALEQVLCRLPSLVPSPLSCRLLSSY